jgi:hypothetical protein
VDPIKIVVRGCASCHFASRVEDSGECVKLYCTMAADRQILPKGLDMSLPPRERWRAYPSAVSLSGPSEEEAYGVAPDWCPLRIIGPITVELARP